MKTQYFERDAVPGRSINVRNDDVNGALRGLKKVLERDDQQRETMAREFFEKASTKKKRASSAGKKRSERERAKRISSGQEQPHVPSNLKYLKSRRSRRKIIDARAAYEQGVRSRSKIT